MMKSLDDTIVAPATPHGESAIAVVRVTGGLCKELVNNALRKNFPSPRHAYFGRWHNLQNKVIDEVLWTFFAGPHSYTGQDVLEVSLHGNPFLVGQLLEDVVARGARLAEPGEFTRRAFLLGKLDLSQAEAVADLIHARSDAALESAHAQKEGSISREMSQRCEDLLEVIAHLEAYIDFPEEDLPDAEESWPAQRLRELEGRLQTLISTEERGRFLREGISVVMVGEPNAGKSSLLNALLRRERALVSPTPGTTRDYITEEIRLAEFCIRFTDTAGLRSGSGDSIENLGMEATRKQLDEADLVLWIMDRSQPPPDSFQEMRSTIEPRPWLWVLNKSDLPADPTWGALTRTAATVSVSALKGDGLEQLETTLLDWVEHKLPPTLPEQILLNARHVQALRGAIKQLKEAREQLGQAGAAELLVEDLRSCLTHFEEVVGRVDNERMLDKLFARFCIGK